MWISSPAARGVLEVEPTVYRMSGLPGESQTYVASSSQPPRYSLHGGLQEVWAFESPGFCVRVSRIRVKGYQVSAYRCVVEISATRMQKKIDETNRHVHY